MAGAVTTAPATTCVRVCVCMYVCKGVCMYVCKGVCNNDAFPLCEQHTSTHARGPRHKHELRHILQTKCQKWNKTPTKICRKRKKKTYARFDAAVILATQNLEGAAISPVHVLQCVEVSWESLRCRHFPSLHVRQFWKFQPILQF